MYAGAGIVPGSDPAAEWEETWLKMRNIQQLVPPPRALRSLPNINTLWAGTAHFTRFHWHTSRYSVYLLYWYKSTDADARSAHPPFQHEHAVAQR